MKTLLVTAFLAGLGVYQGAGQSLTFSEQLNPTGDPIGGDVGYSRIVLPEDAAFVVTTRSELMSALGAAQQGHTIYVDDEAEIDLSGEQDVLIPEGVTLASGRGRDGSRGALIYSDTFHPNNSYVSLFRTGGPDVRVTGLRLRGPFGDIGDHHYDIVGVANGIRGAHGRLEVDNCELWNWNKWAIDLEVAIGDHIHHNFIHHNRRAGYGYGVWVRGTGTGTPPARDDIPLIEANLFDYSRHHIGSGSQYDSSWEARYNIVMPHNVQQRFDRHGDADGAGYDTWVHHNWFMGTNDVDMHFRGPAHGTGQFFANWTDEEQESRSVAISNVSGGSSNIDVSNNTYGGVASSLLPVARAALSVTEGPAPLTVTFDASSSSPGERGEVTLSRWHFGDGNKARNEWTTGKQVQHTFEEPGTYYVELIVFDDLGIPSPPVLIPVHVYPPGAPSYILSAWLKDSYSGDLAGHYKKQVLVNGTVVWEDDVAGDEGWFHLVHDLSGVVDTTLTVDLAFRIQTERAVIDPVDEIIQVSLYVDNVGLQGSDLQDGHFEEVDWDEESSGANWIVGRASEEALTGKWSYVLKNRYRSTSNSGDFAQITRRVSFSYATSSIYGDVSRNGQVTPYDAVRVMEHLIGLANLEEMHHTLADVSGNGVVSVYDASMILKYVMGFIECFPVEEGCNVQ